jgi:hypothetical protein
VFILTTRILLAARSGLLLFKNAFNSRGITTSPTSEWVRIRVWRVFCGIMMSAGGRKAINCLIKSIEITSKMLVVVEEKGLRLLLISYLLH